MLCPQSVANIFADINLQTMETIKIRGGSSVFQERFIAGVLSSGFHLAGSLLWRPRVYTYMGIRRAVRRKNYGMARSQYLLDIVSVFICLCPFQEWFVFSKSKFALNHSPELHPGPQEQTIPPELRSGLYARNTERDPTGYEEKAGAIYRISIDTGPSTSSRESGTDDPWK